MVKHEEIGTRTRGGRCPVHVFTPNGVSHGWMKPEFPVYDEAAAERGRFQISALFNRALK